MDKKRALTIVEPLLSIALAFLAGSLVIAIIKENPLDIYALMVKGAFGSEANIATTLNKTTSLIFASLSYAFAYKCGLVSIGAEGQLYIGAMCSTLVGIMLDGVTAIIVLPLCILAGFLGGAVWGALVGWLKVRFNANEVITTVMLNYIAIHLISYVTSGPFKDPEGQAAQTKLLAEEYWLPILVPGTKIHFGLVLAVLALIGVGIFLAKTKPGFGMRIVGASNSVAAYSGINVKKNVMMAMFISGGFGGLAGTMDIMGIQHRLLQGFSNGTGFDGVAVALLGGNNPIGIFFSSTLFGALKTGGNAVQMFSSVPVSVVNVIQSVVIVFVLLNVLGRIKKTRGGIRRCRT